MRVNLGDLRKLPGRSGGPDGDRVPSRTWTICSFLSSAGPFAPPILAGGRPPLATSSTPMPRAQRSRRAHPDKAVTSRSTPTHALPSDFLARSVTNSLPMPAVP